MQEGGFQYKDKDNEDGMERMYNNNNGNGNYEYRGSEFSFDGQWDFNCCICLNVIVCFEVYKGSQLKSLKAFYEPVRLSEFEQGQMNLALLHAMKQKMLQKDTFKAPCCCFENVSNTAHTVVCTINVSIDCNGYEVPNLPQKKNILK